jgi:LDH2 family malate/lactate/ureidoglycolate dehydrogenase
VDVLAGVLPGAGYADRIYPKTPDGRPLPADVGHFFGAIRIEGFRPLDEFKASMDDIIARLTESSKADGQERIYIHGEKEYEAADTRSREGIPLHPKVAVDLRAIAVETGVPYEL